ncbi:hypothetical protein LOK49_LG02G01058 [Camellia lanceoleosa]|uniref:Uncharacterized protein n=1 Tax=Camellia lanceoleosa TaxID=1840588 RepID=A0ACC0IHJ9_9ERIC|nr:hypothetical protein LOK49_LG02G01058 [Camellia lanceoleosa]
MPCIRTCKYGPPNPNGREGMRKGWEKWDLRILVLCILFTQLYLHVFGRHRRKGTTQLMISGIVWFFYLFSDLLATIALGKLSKVKGDDEDLSPISLLRGLWAPIILFCLGGSDTMTVLRLEENQMWLRHAIGLLTQGLRASYVLILTWTSTMRFSLLALLMLFPGLIKYGERVWVIKSISEKKYVGFVRIDENTIRKISSAKPNSEAELVLQAYSYFQTLNPLISNSQRDRSEWTKKICELLNKDGDAHNTFKLIEIELGLMYDMLFSKVGTIFTVYGSILRLICVSCIVTVLVCFFIVKKPDGHLKGDLPITIILLVGALCLEIGGVLVQLGSDWAIVWACKHYPSKLVTPIFHLHESVISKNKRWFEVMGQSRTKFSLPPHRVDLSIKKLIICQLGEISQVETSQAYTIKRGEWTLEKYGLDANWSIELEFGKSIFVWHIATDICYDSEPESSKSVPNKVETTKILSYYMMHLLRFCPALPFCKNSENVDKFFEKEKSNGEKLALSLDEKGNSKWEIMSNMWVEMLCYAASCCSVEHVQELRRGGQFLTRVWLLLMHSGATKKLEENASQQSNDKEDRESELVDVVEGCCC